MAHACPEIGGAKYYLYTHLLMTEMSLFILKIGLIKKRSIIRNTIRMMILQAFFKQRPLTFIINGKNAVRYYPLSEGSGKSVTAGDTSVGKKSYFALVQS